MIKKTSEAVEHYTVSLGQNSPLYTLLFLFDIFAAASKWLDNSYSQV